MRLVARGVSSALVFMMPIRVCNCRQSEIAGVLSQTMVILFVPRTSQVMLASLKASKIFIVLQCSGKDV